MLLKTDWINHMEYGMVRDLEDAIASKTGAEIYSHPQGFLTKRAAHGTRYAPLRKIFPKSKFLCNADVLWVPLMAPEDFQLDLFNGWDISAKRKILYLFDTFPHQFYLIKKIVKRYKWDLLITSFSEAVEPLTKITKRQWHCVPQGVNLSRFYPRQWGKEEIPPIFISVYGRRRESYHAEIKKWCLRNQRWYDYTTAASHRLSVPTQDNYACLANHIGSSIFSVCWPMEIVDSPRSGGLSPITCRWFEGAASGAVLVGQPPQDPLFDELFGKDAVLRTPEKLHDVAGWLDELQADASQLRAKVLVRLSQYKDKWSWESRVQAILNLLT